MRLTLVSVVDPTSRCAGGALAAVGQHLYCEQSVVLQHRWNGSGVVGSLRSETAARRREGTHLAAEVALVVLAAVRLQS